VAYRAHVRAKVACLQTAQGRTEASVEARRLLDLSYAHLRRARVALVLIGGLPGTGKSTLAEGVGRELGWTVLRSDEVRKDREGVGHLTARPAPVGRGMYSEASRDATYRELLHRARSLLELGEPVVLDASWTDRHWRDAARDLAAETCSDLLELRCAAPLDVARARLVARTATATDPSDATLEVLEHMASREVPWPSAVEIDTTSGLAPALDAALAAVRCDGSGGATVAE
jgi:hypothetical protein